MSDISRQTMRQREALLNKKLGEVQAVLNSEGGTSIMEQVGLLEILKVNLIAANQGRQAQLEAMRAQQLAREVQKLKPRSVG
jgi:hypothetical protein